MECAGHAQGFAAQKWQKLQKPESRKQVIIPTGFKMNPKSEARKLQPSIFRTELNLSQAENKEN